MYRKTGESAPSSGVYHSACRCRSEITVRKGEAFPQCPRCRGEVAWMFTRSVYGRPEQRPPPE